MVSIFRYSLFQITHSNTMFHDRAIAAELAHDRLSLNMLEYVVEGTEAYVDMRDMLRERRLRERGVWLEVLALLALRGEGQGEAVRDQQAGNAIMDSFGERVEGLLDEQAHDEQEYWEEWRGVCREELEEGARN